MILSPENQFNLKSMNFGVINAFLSLKRGLILNLITNQHFADLFESQNEQPIKTFETKNFFKFQKQSPDILHF